MFHWLIAYVRKKCFRPIFAPLQLFDNFWKITFSRFFRDLYSHLQIYFIERYDNEMLSISARYLTMSSMQLSLEYHN